MIRAPHQFELDEEIYEIDAVLDQWYEPSAMYFKVMSTVGKTYLLRHDEQEDEWTPQSGFDGDELVSRPGIDLITVDADVIRRPEKLLESCERCDPDAQLLFDIVLDRVMHSDPARADDLLEPARCPRCRGPILKQTLVDLRDDVREPPTFPMNASGYTAK